MKRNIALAVLGAAAVAALVVALLRGRPRSSAQEGIRGVLGDGGATFYEQNAWLDSCLKSCRAMAERRLTHLSVEKQRQYCDVNCECGMQKMTEPGPKPNEIRAPSAAWLALTQEQQMQAARECQQRGSQSVGGVQPPGAP